MTPERPAFYRFANGDKAPLPFAAEEYEARLEGLRDIIAMHGLDTVVLTSMHNIAYYSGFLYCAFGRPFACVVTPTDCVTVAAGIDAGQPWRRCHGDALSYTDWARDNFWRAVAHVAGTGGAVGVEADHLTLVQSEKLNAFLKPQRGMDISPATMAQRMVKSDAEIALIRDGAAVADAGGYAIRDTIREGLREIDVAMAGRDAMELEIARRFPDAEYRDTWVWLQSGLNTDGAHNPVTGRVLRRGDILSLNAFPMISGYYTALERTLFVGEVDAASRAIWEANVATHEYGHEPAAAGRELRRDRDADQRLPRRARPAAIPHFRLRPQLRRAQPLLRPRGRAGAARGHRHGAGARHGDLDGADADHSRGTTRRGRLSRA